jgi:hypothetical protein
MANLYFPQLMSGAMAQYPITRTRVVRTVKNVMASGDLILYPDMDAGYIIWELEYTELSKVDLAALQAHLAVCAGPYRAFTFLDPTGNLLTWSSDLTQPVWGAPKSLAVAAGVADPEGGTAALSMLNKGQIAQGVAQTLAIPASYQYVFSIYLQSAAGASVTLSKTGQSSAVSETIAVGANWQRVDISSTLRDTGNTLSIGLTLDPGQQVNVYAPQLEPQIAPSRARLTGPQGGVYANAHWGVNSLPVIALAPGLFSTSFTVEATV